MILKKPCSVRLPPLYRFVTSTPFFFCSFCSFVSLATVACVWNYAGRCVCVALTAAHASHIDKGVRRRLKQRGGDETCLIKLHPDEMGRADLMHMDQGLLP